MLPKSCFLAAVDLGSNSFRLEINQYKNGRIRRTEYLREPVRLGRGLDANLYLSEEAMSRGWKYLEKLGNHLKQVKAYQVRAIATQTLRLAKNQHEFIKRGEQLLGYPIEVIPGEDEALLIYMGVCALLDAKKTYQKTQSTKRRLVIDIGGRSTEIILGQGLKPYAAVSVPIGSVGVSMDFFSNGLMQENQFENAIASIKTQFDTAILSLKQQMEAINQPFIWETSYGASGTIGAIGNVLKRNQVTSGKITSEGVEWIYKKLLQAKTIDRINLAGLGERRDVVGGGFSILQALFTSLHGLHTIQPARGALRQGIIFEMVRPTLINMDNKAQQD